MTYANPVKPIPFSTDKSSAFYKEALDVYNQVKSNTAEQVEITVSYTHLDLYKRQIVFMRAGRRRIAP